MLTFTRVVEAGSLTRAAEKLGIAKSAVSRRLADLETRLGVQLFRRTTRHLNVTVIGRGFYDRCVRILADVEEAEAAVSKEHAALSGTLKVAVPVSFGLLHLGPAICEFLRAHPQVRFDLDFNDREVDLLQEGIDVAIRIARLKDSGLIARPIAPIRLFAYASPAYLAERGIPRRPEDLADHLCLVYSNAPEQDVWTYRGADGRQGRVRVPVGLRANNGDFLRHAAVAGHGIVVSPSFICRGAVDSGELVTVLDDIEWERYEAYAVYPHTRHLSQRVRAFVDFLVERFSGVPSWDRSP